MRKKTLLLSSLFIGILGYSQTVVNFKFDSAGNQVFRGTALIIKPLSSTLSKTTTLVQAQIIDESTFWEQIRLYPVPVNDVLTIDWTEDVDGLVESISLYQHNTVSWKFQQQNIPDLNQQLKINMSGYDWGVYVLRFTLKDGRTFSKNITKN